MVIDRGHQFLANRCGHRQDGFLGTAIGTRFFLKVGLVIDRMALSMIDHTHFSIHDHYRTITTIGQVHLPLPDDRHLVYNNLLSHWLFSTQESSC